MPSLKEIKTRIASVQSTRKITSAMKMVASSKLHHAQTAIQNMLPYENMLEHGGYNANVIRMMQNAVDEYKKKGVEDILVYPVGRKVMEKATKLGYHVAGDFVELADKPSAAPCAAIAEELAEKFAKHEVDKVEMIYHHFKSAGTQILTRSTFLPIDLSTEKIGADNDRDLSSNEVTAKAQAYLRKHGQAEERQDQAVKPLNDDFIVEPDLKSVLSVLIPKQLNLMVYTALLDSNASEHAARMVAMQTATDNADEILKELKLQYNKSRQAAITSEMLDIVGGSVNN